MGHLHVWLGRSRQGRGVPARRCARGCLPLAPRRESHSGRPLSVRVSGLDSTGTMRHDRGASGRWRVVDLSLPRRLVLMRNSAAGSAARMKWPRTVGSAGGQVPWLP